MAKKALPSNPNRFAGGSSLDASPPTDGDETSDDMTIPWGKIPPFLIERASKLVFKHKLLFLAGATLIGGWHLSPPIRFRNRIRFQFLWASSFSSREKHRP